jgi:hypothetical protein
MANRGLAVSLVEKYFPTTGYLRSGQLGFNHICKDYLGAGTTCGFLPHWLWWRMGCQDSDLVNRYEPDTRFKYADGKNINRVYAHGAFVNLAYKKYNDAFLEGTIYPDAGDAILIKGDPFPNGVSSEHIFVALDYGTWESGTKGSWRIAQTGQKYSGAEAGHITSAAVEYRNGKWMIGKRWMLGWLDLEKVHFASSGPGPELLAPSSTIFVPESPLVDARGVWKVVTGAGVVWYYVFYKGYRVFWANGYAPGILNGGGWWIPESGQITIKWDDGGLERMWPSAAKQATGTDGEFSWSATKVGADRTIMNSFHDRSGIAVGAAAS